MGEIQYIIGQGFGILAIALGFLSFQMKTQRQLILAQTATSICFCLNYLLIGAFTGMAMNIVSTIRNLFYYRRNQRGDQRPLLPIIFACIMGVMGVISWEAWYSIFVFLGLVINTLCMSFSDPQKVRKSILVTSPLVLIYDVFVLSIGGLVYEAVAIASALIGIFREKERRSPSDPAL